MRAALKCVTFGVSCGVVAYWASQVGAEHVGAVANVIIWTGCATLALVWIAADAVTAALRGRP